MTNSGPGQVEGMTLDELLEAARVADRTTRVETYRDAIAEHGQPAISKLSTWLVDPADANFALTVIERAGREFDFRAEAIRALRAGRRKDDARAVWAYIDGALERLKVPPVRAPRPVARSVAGATYRTPRGTRVAPAYRDVHHVVVDYVADSGTTLRDLYLFACGRFFSGDWVRGHGGLRDAAGLPICNPCGSAVERGA